MRRVLSTAWIALFTSLGIASARAEAGVDNPATALCLKDGAKIVTGTAPSGSQHNVCVFPSGARINDWAYFRNKHRTTH